MGELSTGFFAPGENASKWKNSITKESLGLAGRKLGNEELGDKTKSPRIQN
jgi:hypothetical protein